MQRKDKKKMWINLILIAALGMMPLCSWSQSKELRVGDAFDYPNLQHVINGEKGSLDLAKYRGKLLILDFWSHGCGACVKGFPKLDSLQQVFDDRIQIVAVNREPFEDTKRFLSRLKTIHPPSFPMVTGDSILHERFPHVLVPLHVWIDTLGRVAYITNARNTNSMTIRNYLSGKEFSLSEIRYDLADTIIINPLVPPLGDGESQYSLLTKSVSGVSVMNDLVRFREGMPDGSRLAANSASIAELFAIAYSEGGRNNFGNLKNMEWIGVDSARIFRPDADSLFNDWHTNHCYNYVLKVPDSLAGNIYRYMQDDLSRYFGISASFVKKRREVLQLQVIDKEILNIRMDDNEIPEDYIRVKKMPISDFVETLQDLLVRQNRSEVILAPNEAIDTISCAYSRQSLSPFSVELINDGLKDYGWRLLRKKARIPVLVLRQE